MLLRKRFFKLAIIHIFLRFSINKESFMLTSLQD